MGISTRVLSYIGNISIMSALRLFARTAVRAAVRPATQRFMSTSVVGARATSLLFRPATLGFQTRSYGAIVPLPTLDETEKRIIQVLTDFEKTDKDKLEQLSVDAHYIKDLGLDSLDVVEVVMHVEEEFDTEIPDHDAETLFTIRETADYVYK